jgi:hypothetical protein
MGMVTVTATIVTIAPIAVPSIAVAAVARWTTLKLFVLFLDIGD